MYKSIFNVILFISLIGLVACSNEYEPEIKEIMPNNQEEILKGLKENIGTGSVDIQPNGSRYSWSKEGMNTIQELSDELLPTLKIQGLFYGEKPNSYIEIIFDGFKLIIPTETKNPEQKISLIFSDDSKVIAIKGDNEKVESIINWIKKQTQ